MLGYGITNPSSAALYPRGDSTRLCRPSYPLLKAQSIADRFTQADGNSGRQYEWRARQVFVRDDNFDQALRILKKKMQREGVIREMKLRRAYEKPSERRTREKAEAIRRARKAARKQAQREGLIPPPKRREDARRPFGRPRSS